MNVFFQYYMKGRVFEWAMAFSMFAAGAELLIWDNVLTFGAFHWLLQLLNQKFIGSFMFFLGWVRISALMFNGQLLFGKKFGWAVRAATAVLSATILSQFALALIELSIDQGFPSVGVPFWTTLVVAELVVAYSVGAEWKKS